MSSRPPPPIQPDPKRRPGHPMAAGQFPGAGARALPLPSLLATPNPRLPPPSGMQTPYKPQSLQTPPGNVTYSAPRQARYPLAMPYAQPTPQPSQTRSQGAVPLDRLLHSQLNFPPGSGSPTSPLGPSQNQTRSPYEDDQVQDYYETAHRPPYPREDRYHTGHVPPGSYPFQRDAHRTSTPSTGAFATPPVHLPLLADRQSKTQDM